MDIAQQFLRRERAAAVLWQRQSSKGLSLPLGRRDVARGVYACDGALPERSRRKGAKQRARASVRAVTRSRRRRRPAGTGASVCDHRCGLQRERGAAALDAAETDSREVAKLEIVGSLGTPFGRLYRKHQIRASLPAS